MVRLGLLLLLLLLNLLLLLLLHHSNRLLRRRRHLLNLHLLLLLLNRLSVHIPSPRPLCTWDSRCSRGRRRRVWTRCIAVRSWMRWRLVRVRRRSA